MRGDDGRYLLVETNPQRRVAVLSMPALGGLRMHARARHAVRTLVRGMADSPRGHSGCDCPGSQAAGGCF